MIAVVWADALIRASIQASLLTLAVWTLFRLTPLVPAAVRSWIWRLVAVKFLFTLAVTIPIESESVSYVSATSGPPTPLASGVLFLSVLGLAYVAVGTVLEMRLVARALKTSYPAPAWVVQQTSQVGCLLEVSTTPNVRLCPATSVPALVGLIRPVILLPASFLRGASEKEVRMVLAHEMAHLRRRDLTWAWLGVALRAAFFFHPLAWLAWREANLADEAACDELALAAMGGSRREYGLLILRLATGQPLSASFAAVAAAGSADSVRRRIDNLARPPRSRRSVTAACLLLALAAVPGYRTVAQPVSPFVAVNPESETTVGTAAAKALMLGRRAPVLEPTHRESRK